MSYMLSSFDDAGRSSLLSTVDPSLFFDNIGNTVQTPTHDVEKNPSRNLCYQSFAELLALLHFEPDSGIEIRRAQRGVYWLWVLLVASTYLGTVPES